MDFLQSLLSTNNKKNLPGIIHFCSETKLLRVDASKGKDVVNFINDLLSKGNNKEGALLVLQTFLKQFPREILSSNVSTWAQHCIRTLLNEDGSICNNSFRLLSELIQLSTNFPEARKEVALYVIPKSLEYIIKELKSPKEGVIVVLQCLEQILHCYGKSCGHQKDEITSLVLSFLEHSPQTVSTCARCFLNLAACGSPGANTENYANNWYLHEKFLLNSLHDMMDSLFDNINHLEDTHKIHDLGEYKHQIPELSENVSMRKKQRLAVLFQSVVEFFIVHLLGAFVASKKILPQSILSLIWRGISANCCTLKDVSINVDSFSLVSVISDINLSCIKLLNALIVSCRMNLMVNSPFICRILSQILHWTNTEDWPYGLTKPYSLIRVEAYKCATNWLTVSGACSGIDKYIEDIVSEIISDVNFERPILTLKVPNGKGKGKKNKQNKEVPVALDYVVDKEANESTCKVALDLIPVILSSSATVMKPIKRELLHSVIVRKLLQIQEAGSSEPPIPYSSPRCRLALYEALLSLCNNSHPSCPPPINYAAVIFSKGMKDSSVEVLGMCVNALNNIGQVLKPPFPSLEFPIITRPVLQTASIMYDKRSILPPKEQVAVNPPKNVTNVPKPATSNGRDQRSYEPAFLSNMFERSSSSSTGKTTLSSETEKKRDLEEIEDSAENVTSKKVKLNGVDEGTSLTVIDDETSLNSINDETSLNVIDDETSLAAIDEQPSCTVIVEEPSETVVSEKVSLNDIGEGASPTAEDSDDDVMFNSFVDDAVDL